MFLRWKKKRIGELENEIDPHCVHSGPGRIALTPMLVKNARAPDGVRQEVISRVGPAIRACCVADPIARYFWWQAVEARFEWLSDIDLDRLRRELAKGVPPPTQEETEIAAVWPRSTPRTSLRDGSRARSREELFETLRRGRSACDAGIGVDRWGQARSAWQTGDDATISGDWLKWQALHILARFAAGLAVGAARRANNPFVRARGEVWQRIIEGRERRAQYFQADVAAAWGRKAAVSPSQLAGARLAPSRSLRREAL